MAVVTAGCGSSVAEGARNLLSSALGDTSADDGAGDSGRGLSADSAWQILDTASDAKASDTPDQESSDENAQPGPQRITARNGVAVEVVPGDDTGPPMAAADRLVVIDAEGNLAWTVAAGGVTAPRLALIDFDGRFVLARRAPATDADADPAHDHQQHFVYDLNCRASDAKDCVDEFWAPVGTGILTATPPNEGDSQLNIQLLSLCPTAGQHFVSPDELTPEWSDRFQRAAAVLSTCDGAGLADESGVGRAGPDSESPASQDGWQWTELAAALRGPYRIDTADKGRTNGPLVWGPTPAGTTVQIQPDGSTRFSVAETAPWGEITVTRSERHLVLSGRANRKTATAAAEAAADMANGNGLQLHDQIDIVASDTPDGDIGELAAAIDAELASAVAGNLHIGPDQHLAQWTVSDDEQPTAAELNMVLALRYFAAGDPAALADLQLADEVYLATGDQLVARRTSAALATRSGWRLDVDSLDNSPGPFNILNQAGDGPKKVTVGARSGCDDTAPDPAPGQLAPLRRLSLQPDGGNGPACRQWSRIDLYLDDSGQIAGVGLNLFDP